MPVSLWTLSLPLNTEYCTVPTPSTAIVFGAVAALACISGNANITENTIATHTAAAMDFLAILLFLTIFLYPPFRAVAVG
jgi:hypothetical protein